MSFQPNNSTKSFNSQFFNQSFYNQRIDQQSSKPDINANTTDSTYVSYEFAKSYFKKTKINQIVNRSIKTTLESMCLPQNPYNMIGRMVLHQCIYQNIRLFYNIHYTGQTKKMQQQIDIAIGSNIDQKKVMKDIKIGNRELTVGWKLSTLIKADRINILWPILFTGAKHKKTKKSKIIQVSQCLGGSLILRVGSVYSAQNSICPTILITTAYAENKEHISQFINYVIDDCIKICESPNNIFIKLFVYTHQPICSQWSAQNLIHSRTKIIKQLTKQCLNNVNQLRAEFLLKVPPEGMKSTGTAYLRVTKTYILIQQQDKISKIHSRRPATILLTSVFSTQSTYFQCVMQSFDSKGLLEQLVHQMHSQLHSDLVYGLQQQQPTWIGWTLLYILLYDFSQNRNKDKQLRSLITYMTDSPLASIDELKHQINVAKIMSSRSSTATHQLQILQILEKCERKVRFYIQKQQHVYPQTVIFFQAVKRNLQLILQNKKNSSKNIKPILYRTQLLIKYLLNSFYQICLVLKGQILDEIIKIDNTFGKDGSGEIISDNVTYDIFLRRYKDLPDRTLNVNNEVTKLRSIIPKHDQDIKQLLLAKYVEEYKLYEKVYEFYWSILSGKKVHYPMGNLMTSFRNYAIRFDARRYKKNQLKIDIQHTKTDGIMIYQKAGDTRGQHLFYALSPEGLQDNQVNNYRQIKTTFQQYFQNDIISQKSYQSLAHLQKNSYILSICNKIGRISSDQSDFNKCKIYVDSIYHVPINPVDIYRIMYDEIVQKIQILDKNGFGVIGIYNGDKEFLDEDEVLPWIQHQQKYDIQYLRYQSKKSMNIQLVTKLLKSCKTHNSEILIRGIFWINGLLKSCQISFNFLINKEWLINNASSYQSRVFTKHQDIARWGNYNGLKQYISTQKKIQGNPKYNRRESNKEKYISNHIDMIQFVAQDMQKPIEINTVKTYSPFYLQLQQSLSLVEGLFYLLQYVKTDKSGKFQVKDFKDTIQILQYYLFVKCLRSDRYIYSQGLSVTIINLVSCIDKYLKNHPDNNGQEKQIICLQKVTIKLMNCIHYVLTSCAFGVIEALQQNYVDNQPDNDEDD